MAKFKPNVVKSIGPVLIKNGTIEAHLYTPGDKTGDKGDPSLTG